jgi:DNA polymerase-3 subunit delta'
MSAGEVVEETWSEVVGQPEAVALLRAAAASPVHAYLFVGPSGAGKREAARAFAAELLSRGAASDEGERHARLAAAETHPDLIVVEPDGARVTIGQAREVIQASVRSPVEGPLQVIVLCEFHRIEHIGAALLKTIEEPPPTTVFVILADEVVPELVTIASRALRVDFGPVPPEVIVERLVAEGSTTDEAVVAADAAAGDLRRARLLAGDPSLAARRQAWVTLPERLDGSGAAVMIETAALREHIDRAQGPLDERQAAEVADLEERVERYGSRGQGVSALRERHRREIRRLRTQELRFGLTTVAARYRAELLAGRATAELLDALRAVQDASEAVDRNGTEELVLEALLLRLPALSPSAGAAH